jgi:hypothetical protein
MPGPFIFVATNKVREGRLEGEKQRVPGWIEFIHGIRTLIASWDPGRRRPGHARSASPALGQAANRG